MIKAKRVKYYFELGFILLIDLYVKQRRMDTNSAYMSNTSIARI